MVFTSHLSSFSQCRFVILSHIIFPLFTFMLIISIHSGISLSYERTFHLYAFHLCTFLRSPCLLVTFLCVTFIFSPFHFHAFHKSVFHISTSQLFTISMIHFPTCQFTFQTLSVFHSLAKQQVFKNSFVRDKHCASETNTARF